MTKIFKKPSSVKLPKSKQEERNDEHGKARKGIVICKRCRNISFKKEWHRHDRMIVREANRAGKEIHFALCPACTMLEQHLYEGELLIENMPPRYESELIHAVNAFGERAELKDPQDRIVDMKKEKKRYRITTTENQLAVKLAKQIGSAFRNLDIHISYSKEPHEVDRVVVMFR